MSRKTESFISKGIYVVGIIGITAIGLVYASVLTNVADLMIERLGLLSMVFILTVVLILILFVMKRSRIAKILNRL